MPTFFCSGCSKVVKETEGSGSSYALCDECLAARQAEKPETQHAKVERLSAQLEAEKTKLPVADKKRLTA